MKTNTIPLGTPRFLYPLFLFAAILLVSGVHAAEAARNDTTLLAPGETERIIAAVRAADDERVSATKAGDRARLEAIYADALRYGHSSGRVETKASFVDALTTRRAIYERYDYLERNFLPAGPGVVVMTGRALLRVRNAQGANDADLIFLAVWREENGRWRFLAWQSCKSAPPAPAAK